MRQAGVIAASGIYALQHHVQRLAEDHAHAERLGEAIKGLKQIRLASPVETNMVMLDPASVDISVLAAYLKDRGILLTGPRLVTHLDITSADIDSIIEALHAFEALSH
jgi:threonine aldolase